MHRYFYDWEFQEQQNPETGLTTIFPISLGMISEDGRELYLVNSTYPEWESKGLVKTSNWVRENVLNHIDQSDRILNGAPFSSFGPYIENFISSGGRIKDRSYVELWGYFSAYDHVCLAQCFGSMIQLPDCIPMHTKDLKQLIPSRTRIGFSPEDEHHALSDARWNKAVWEMFAEDKRV